MEALLLAIYSFFVWLIFIKKKWLPWNTTSQVTVVVIPIVAMTALILTLNVIAPSTSDVRVIKYVVQVIPQVKGRVIEVPVEPNRLVKKGELLFRIDPTQYQNDLGVAKGQRLRADDDHATRGDARAGGDGDVERVAGEVLPPAGVILPAELDHAIADATGPHGHALSSRLPAAAGPD